MTAYNVATNTWTFRHRLPKPLAGSNGAGVINGKIYVSGGYSDYGGDFPWAALSCTIPPRIHGPGRATSRRHFRRER